jgi:hypothetical protein
MYAQCKRNTCSFGVCEALVVRINELLHHFPVMNKCHSKCTNIRTEPVATFIEPEDHVPVIGVTLWAESYTA